MAKFHGEIGYAISTETAPGVWTDVITSRDYVGDLLRETKQWKEANQANDNLVVSHRISVIGDDFASANLTAMRYVVWAGVYWKISTVEMQRPRLILSLGGVYNGPKD